MQIFEKHSKNSITQGDWHRSLTLEDLKREKPVAAATKFSITGRDYKTISTTMSEMRIQILSQTTLNLD